MRSQNPKPAMATSKNLTLKLLVDKEKNRVVFAESDKDFVDILFSFLTLPLGTIIRLLDKKSSLGCLDRLYKSVEDLDSEYLQTEECKTMLLRPRSAAGIQCESLAINIDDSGHRVYYRCPSSGRESNHPRNISSVPGVPCSCGKRMDVPVLASNVDVGKGSDGVFVKGVTRFIISDDLQVKPVSMGDSFALIDRFGILDGNVLENRTVNVGEDEVLRLLKVSLVSKTPLTDVFLRAPAIIDMEEKSVRTYITQARVKHKRAATDVKRISVKLYLSKENGKVVYAEAGEDLVDILFSFLTFPLGSMIRFLDKHSFVGCIDNLYESVEVLSTGCDYVKSEVCKNMLLAPKLAPHFSRSSQMLGIEEVVPVKIRTCTCCTSNGAPVTAGKCALATQYTEMNPKQHNSGSGTGEGYAKKMKFLVTDEMEVTPLSPISGLLIINKLMVPISSLEEAEASLGEAEALNLLRACLVSDTVLTDVFSPYVLMLLEQNWSGQLPRKSDHCPDQL